MVLIPTPGANIVKDKYVTSKVAKYKIKDSTFKSKNLIESWTQIFIVICVNT